jgi:protein SCO1/2
MWQYSRFISLLALGAAPLAVAPAAQQTRYSRSVEYYALPQVKLVDMSGRGVSLTSVLHHPGATLLQFIFTTCSTICPVLSGTFASAQDKLGAELDGLRMVSISIDPEHDTPARLRDYARKSKAKAQWLFLTGRNDDIVAVQEAFKVYQGSKMRHQPITFMRASPDDAWVRLDGLMSAADLVAEYHRIVGH